MKKKTARLPTDYIGGTCEGRQASPSIPNQEASAGNEKLTESVIFRCTAAEKVELVSKAKLAGLPNSTMMREALGLVEAKRRKPMPTVSPELILTLARIGGNVNQIARWINTAHKTGQSSTIEALKLTAYLIAIERQLAAIRNAHSRQGLSQ